MNCGLGFDAGAGRETGAVRFTIGNGGSGGNADTVDQVADDRLGGGELAGLEERLAHDAVRQHRHGERLDVVGDHVIAPRDQRQALRGAVEGQGPSGADADVQVLALAGGVHEIEQVVGDGVVDPDLTHAAAASEITSARLRTGSRFCTGSPPRWLVRMSRSTARSG